MAKKGLNLAISILFGAIAATLLATAVVVLVIHYWPSKPNYSNYKNNTSAQTVELPPNPIDFDKVKEQNDDVCGWIEMKSLNIDYPIACAGEDKPEEYYLRRDLDGNYSTAGTIFIQKVNAVDFSDRVTVVYGHDMANLSMFGELEYLRDKETFDQNEFFYIYRPGHIMKFAIKSAFVYDDRHLNYSFNNFVADSDFSAFAEEATNPRSLVKNVRDSVDITLESKLVVLSTCTNIDTERYLVVGVMVEDTKTK